MLVNFVKMHSLGNDFVILDLISQQVKLYPKLIKQLADRRFGVGCDQVLVVAPPKSPEEDFYFRAFNADSSEAERCGNGICCAARYLYDSGLIGKQHLIAGGLSGKMHIEINHQQQVSVDLGRCQSDILSQQINIVQLPNEIYTLSMGNPHGICIVDDLAHVKLYAWGKKLSRLPCFPHQANISFMQILSATEIKLAVYERGVGPTLACGSAACAAVVVANYLKIVGDKVKVNFQFGHLMVSIESHTQHISLTGVTTSVFAGKLRM